MGKTQIQNNLAENTTTAGQTDGETVEILYQKMGDRWFAFSLIDDEIFVGSLTQDQIEGVDKDGLTKRTIGNT